MTRTARYEAMISPILEIPTRFGVRRGFEVLVRDLAGGAPLRFARHVQVYSTDVRATQTRAWVRNALIEAYGPENVHSYLIAQWRQMLRFVFDETAPDTPLAPSDLPLLDPDAVTPARVHADTEGVASETDAEEPTIGPDDDNAAAIAEIRAYLAGTVRGQFDGVPANPYAAARALIDAHRALRGLAIEETPD